MKPQASRATTPMTGTPLGAHRIRSPPGLRLRLGESGESFEGFAETLSSQVNKVIEATKAVDQVYAHSLQSGMASVAERVTARALGEQPKLRVIESKQRDIRVREINQHKIAKESATG